MADVTDTKSFLVEIGTEELPPKSLRRLALAFQQQFNALTIGQELQNESTAAKNEVLFSPRRLAIHAPILLTKQPDRREERLGPALAAAFDKNGSPTKAAEGFAKSCGVTVGQLERRVTDKGERLAYTLDRKGKTAAELLPQIVNIALSTLPIPKRMRWGTDDIEFVRPVHWVMMLLGERALKAEILGVKAGNQTFGHRFHHPAAITLKRPAAYRKALATIGKVLVEDLAGTLAKKIAAQVTQAAKKVNGKPQLDAALLEEVSALVEWPVSVTGGFDKRFLELPDEVIVTVLETQQRYFPLRNAKGKLLPHFIAVSNIKSKQPQEIRRGNERVIVPRLADAMFFWDTDRKTRLDARIPELDRVVFQKELGSYGDKSRRVAQLAGAIAKDIGGDPKLAERAAQLCKCDLVTGLVGEFPELQGVMGGYYARHDGEAGEVAAAIAEHYQPRFAGDDLPKTKTGQALAIADKLDTIVGIFAIGQKPSGEKDPFGLRRAGLGLMRIFIEKNLALDLKDLINSMVKRLFIDVLSGVTAPNNVNESQIFDFLLERLRTYYLETGIRADVFEAVRAKQSPQPLDFHRRVQAVNAFLTLPEAVSLAAANKRIANILRQAGEAEDDVVRPDMLEEAEEKSLHEKIVRLQRDIQPLLAAGDYTSALKKLAALREPVDRFFDKVLVMDPDAALRANRLALLARLRSLFLHTADLSLIQMDQ